jgi:hypothetical protein
MSSLARTRGIGCVSGEVKEGEGELKRERGMNMSKWRV